MGILNKIRHVASRVLGAAIGATQGAILGPFALMKHLIVGQYYQIQHEQYQNRVSGNTERLFRKNLIIGSIPGILVSPFILVAGVFYGFFRGLSRGSKGLKKGILLAPKLFTTSNDYSLQKERAYFNHEETLKVTMSTAILARVLRPTQLSDSQKPSLAQLPPEIKERIVEYAARSIPANNLSTEKKKEVAIRQNRILMSFLLTEENKINDRTFDEIKTELRL